jgi:hypothetical protein
VVYFFGTGETAEQIEERIRKVTERKTGKIVLEAERDRQRSRVEQVQGEMYRVEAEMRRIRTIRVGVEWELEVLTAKVEREEREWKERKEAAARSAEDARRGAEDARRERERKTREEREMERRGRERMERERKEREERERKMREEEARREQERKMSEERERKRRAELLKRFGEEQRRVKVDSEAEAECEWKEVKRREARPEQERKKARPGDRYYPGLGATTLGNDEGHATATISCQHWGWWFRQEGARICHHCRQFAPLFAFTCPGCSMVACALCRDKLGPRWASREKRSLRRGIEVNGGGYVYSSRRARRGRGQQDFVFLALIWQSWRRRVWTSKLWPGRTPRRRIDT